MTEHSPHPQFKLSATAHSTNGCSLMAEIEMLRQRVAELETSNQLLTECEQQFHEQVTKLEKINESLKRSLSFLATEPNLEKFLGQVLGAIAEQLNSPLAEYWYYQGDIACIGMMSWQGKVYNRAEIAQLLPNHPGIKGLTITPEIIPQERLQYRKQYFMIESTSARFANTDWLPEWQSFFGNIDKELNIPMVFRDHCIGAFIIRTNCHHQFNTQQIELAQTITHQATLAVQLTQLTEEAKQAAVAQKREVAAQQRVTELTKVNAALRRSLDALTANPEPDSFIGRVLVAISEQFNTILDALTANPELDSFIGRVLVAISEQFNAIAVEFWGHRDANVAYPISLVINGRTMSAAEMATHPWKDGVEVPPEMVDYVPLDRRTRHFIIDDNWTKPLITKEGSAARRWYEMQGITISTQLNIPLNLGGRSPGALAIYLPPGHQITDDQIEIAYALTHQLGLAVELTRFASQSKEMALIDERNRVAREIHDTLAQSFAGILIQLETLHQERLDITCPVLQRIQQLAEEGLAQARQSVRSLRPCELDNSNLFIALPQLVDRLSSQTHVSIQLTLTGVPYPLPSDTAGNLFRIAQEALNNALKHAQATIIRVELLYEPETVMLSIEDDGQGFDPQQQLLPTGFGIIGMQERAERIGGQFSLSSGIGNGTTIAVIVANMQQSVILSHSYPL